MKQLKHIILFVFPLIFFSCGEPEEEIVAEKLTAGPVPDQIVLTWQQDPTTTMTVTWRTGEFGGAQSLRYSTSKNAPASSWERIEAVSFTFDETKSWLHTAELTGLKPDTDYHVVIEHPVAPEHFFFRTIPSQRNREIVFLAGGDSRTQQNIRREMNRMAAEKNPDFIVFSGDFINGPLNENDWNEWFDDWHELLISEEGQRFPIVPAIGNHEVKGGYLQPRENAPFFFNRFITPEPRNHYVLDFGPDLAVITLDSDHVTPVDKQTHWLDSTLYTLADKTWKIVQYHVPAWPSVRSINDEIPTRIRENWVPLFEKHNVNLVHEAHDHALKKTVPIRNNQKDTIAGIVYIGDGSWGAPLKETKNPDDHWYLEEAASVYHFWKITLSKDGSALDIEPVILPPVSSFTLTNTN